MLSPLSDSQYFDYNSFYTFADKYKEYLAPCARNVNAVAALVIRRNQGEFSKLDKEKRRELVQHANCSQAALEREINRQVEIRSKRDLPLIRKHKPSLLERLSARLTNIAVRVSSDQSGIISIHDAELIDRDRHNRMWLMHANKKCLYCKHSRRDGGRVEWWRSMSWLVGYDPDQPSKYFCFRVPGTIKSIKQAFDWIEPAEVKKARAKGKRVVRQGDVYIIQSTRDNVKTLPRNHVWDSGTRTLSHHQHGTLQFDYPIKVVVQKAVHSQGSVD